MRPDCGGFAIPTTCRIIASNSVHLHAPPRYAAFLIGVWSEATTLEKVCATNRGPTCLVKNAHIMARFVPLPAFLGMAITLTTVQSQDGVLRPML